MKRSRFTEEQIIGVLREQEAGAVGRRALPQARDFVGDVLRLEGEVRRDGCVGRQAAQGARGRERAAEAALCRRDARQRRAEGTAGKKMVTPAARREAVAHLRASLEVSERRACSHHRRGPEHGPLSSQAPRRRRAARAAARAGGSASAVRLPPPACPSPRRGLDHEPQEDPAALRRGGPGGAPAQVAAADRGGAHADPEAGGSQQPLVDGLRSRPAGQRPPVPGADDHRRRHQGVPRRRPGHLAVRASGWCGR